MGWGAGGAGGPIYPIEPFVYSCSRSAIYVGAGACIIACPSVFHSGAPCSPVFLSMVGNKGIGPSRVGADRIGPDPVGPDGSDRIFGPNRVDQSASPRHPTVTLPKQE